MHGLVYWLQADTWNRLLIGVAGLLALVAIVVLAGGRKKRPVVQEISLRDLSALWTREGAKTIHISELAPLWRDEQLIARQGESLDLRHPRAAAFMENIRQWAWFAKFPLHKAVCGRILQMLDREGHCPSVVNMSGDVEGSWDENTYRILAKTTLLDHSLNVAEQVVQLLSASEAWHVIPDTMVAALAHDLGKLESMRGYLYSLGEHPLAAGRPLAGIVGFKDLAKKEEILRAIKLHHKMPEGLLGKTLKKADQLARQKELEEVVAQQESVTESIPQKSPEALAQRQDAENDKAASSSVPEPARQDTTDKAAAAWQAQADIFDENGAAGQGKDAPEVPKLLDISAWFVAALFLDELKPFINKMFGRRFLAFSMPDGHVYFQVKVLEEVARKQAERAGCIEIATMAQNDPTMRQVLFTIVHHLRSEHDVIARGLIKDNFFGGYFTVIKKIGKNVKGYYTPFHAEAFGSIAEMEKDKPAMLRDIQKVEPYLNDGTGP
ncbi:MAG: HD domain-containing protein [Thermodesulfobacteriota bacterium]